MFTPSRVYTPTQFDTAADKLKFAKQFVRFVESDFKETIFPKWFYNRLSMTFGHIAHYNQSGFYATFFTSTAGKVNFLKQTVSGGQYGSPEYTYCDVERDLAAWVKANGLVQKYTDRYYAETEASERAVLAKLQAKYG